GHGPDRLPLRDQLVAVAGHQDPAADSPLCHRPAGDVRSVAVTVVEPEVSRIELMGLPIDAYTPPELTRHLVQTARAGRGGYVMAPNLDHLRTVAKSEVSRAMALSADIRVADGMPLMWASRLQGTPLPGRVAGSDLIYTLSDAAAKNGLRI